jgi:hypothetical protein
LFTILGVHRAPRSPHQRHERGPRPLAWRSVRTPVKPALPALLIVLHAQEEENLLEACIIKKDVITVDSREKEAPHTCSISPCRPSCVRSLIPSATNLIQHHKTFSTTIQPPYSSTKGSTNPIAMAGRVRPSVSVFGWEKWNVLPVCSVASPGRNTPSQPGGFKRVGRCSEYAI